MRSPVRSFGDRVARRIAFEVNRDHIDEPLAEPEIPSSREQYLAIGMLRDRPAQGSGGLTPSELRVFSQNGEDGVLAEILARIGVERRFFVEFGVQDGVQCNTRYLAEVLGWSGVYFEADAAAFGDLEQRLRNRTDLTTVQALVTPENVEQLFRDAGVPTELDVLSIDVDGQDYWIWQAIEGYQPSVVVIEYNAALPADELLVEPRGGSAWEPLVDFFGASLGAIRALGEQKGYALVHADLAGVNAFFVRTDLAGAFDQAPLLRGPNFDLAGRRQAHYTGPEEYERVAPGDASTSGPDRAR